MPIPERFFAGVFKGVKRLTDSLRPPKETLEDHLRRADAVDTRVTAALKNTDKYGLTQEAINVLGEAMYDQIGVAIGRRK